MNRTHVAALILLAGLGLGCESQVGETRPADRDEPSEPTNPFADVREAIATVHPLSGSKCKGLVRFTQVEGGAVRVLAEIEGLTPKAKHGFHVHEFGDCSSHDGKSAGGHYNPDGHLHGGPDTEDRHPGDFGNLEANAKGVARLDIIVRGTSIAGRNQPLLGRSVIIHAGTDDLTTQPTGNAGDRIGCGVIGVAKPSGK